MKTKLEKGEFAINDGAKFQVAKTGKFKINKKGNVTVTFELVDPDKNLQQGPGDIKKEFVKCGVFKESSPDNFISGRINDLTLSVGSDLVKIQSAELDMDLNTNGEKGQHGVPVL